MTDGAPVTAEEVAARMAAFDPFEPRPVVAVAVSGGPDSLALTLLLANWAAARGGRVLGITVDHGLRPEAAEEARWVGEVLAARGIEHRVVGWQGERPERVRQQHAREERYDRLRAVCAQEGILHLALGHHRADRAETVLLRLKGQSRLDGLAGMAHQREMPEVRLIRPLIDLPKGRLIATLRDRGLGWVDDPSNRNPDHLRVHMRALLPHLAEDGLTVTHINALAGALGTARRTVEAAQDALLARAVTLHPAGFARLDPGMFRDARPEVADGALARALLAVGGAIYPPRGGRLERLAGELRTGLSATRTLGGCQVIPCKAGLLVVREWERVAAMTLHPGEAAVVDGRFEVTLSPTAPGSAILRPLGRAGWAGLTQRQPSLKAHALPGPVRPALMGVFEAQECAADGARGLVAVPELSHLESNGCAWLADWRYAPRRALTGAGFTVVQDEAHTMS
ncbi:tRNA lysidine(34) synthetase TilS [Rhodovibrio salinarum]|uniref:tRNA(Ile)-lysidine synthase n=1 Tax=Rhodovibrio salinarum TaxID=1087 RepID=A0A934QHW3_9PROT|nr:tRNA lysidine(34) synthetase TilS [Rhodovibrio salinarum]MBK1697328.1 tRNA lysidine(34) synthetase TilS [Rhodovibrio salinarum]